MNHIDLVNRSLVSVIIPTYKRATTLLDAIRSVLNQTYKNIEIVIVDDNGKGTYEQLETERLLKHTGLMASHGAYINFLDDDDKMYPQKIEKQVQRLEFTDESIGATYCNSQITHYQNITHKKIVKFSNIEKEGNLCIEYILGKARFNTSMIMFKRSAIEYIGGFDESYTRHQDYEMMIRFFRYFKIVCTAVEPLAIYDQTSDRINTPNCEKDFLMKQKLMSDFSADFEKYRAKNDVAHYLWLRCAINSALKKNPVYIEKSLTLCREYGKITLGEYLKLLRGRIVGYVKSLKHG